MKSKTNEFKIIEDEVLVIHPALDFTSDMAVVTIPLPTQHLTGTEGDLSLTQEQRYWTITDKKETFLYDQKEFQDRNFMPSGVCYVLSNRWHYKNSLSLWLGNEVAVSPKELFFSIKDRYEYYLDYVDSRNYTFFTLWSIGTYLFPLFNAYPIPFLNGGSGSGKSKTIDTTEQIAFNAINTANISDASIYRIIQGTRATLLLDENEKIADSEEAKTLINLVLAGFKKGAKVIRLEKGKKNEYIPTKFEVHCPKMIANIRGIHEEALKNRCIPFIMTPSQNKKSNFYPTGDEPEWQGIRNSLYVFTMNHWKEIRDVKQQIVASDYGLNGYAFMMWHPIITLAKYLEEFVGSDPLEAMRSLAMEKINERKEEVSENHDRKLLMTIKKVTDPIISEGNQIFLSSASIFEALKIELGFKDDDIPKWFTPQRVGRMVNSLDIGKPKTAENQRGYFIDSDRLKVMLNRFGLSDVS